eukprot:SAG25_NODE_1208_length_3611_cov_3.817198_4_plen_75_part_00
MGGEPTPANAATAQAPADPPPTTATQRGGVVHPDSASGCVQDILLCTTVTSAIATTQASSQVPRSSRRKFARAV